MKLLSNTKTAIALVTALAFTLFFRSRPQRPSRRVWDP